MLLIHEKAETEKRNCVDREVCWKHTEWESDVRVCRSDCGWRWEMVNHYWALRDWWWLLSLQRGSSNVKIYATRCSETRFPLFLIVNFRWYTHCRCSWAYISSVMLLCRRHHHRRRVKPEIRAPAAWHTKKTSYSHSHAQGGLKFMSPNDTFRGTFSKFIAHFLSCLCFLFFSPSFGMWVSHMNSIWDSMHEFNSLIGLREEQED